MDRPPINPKPVVLPCGLFVPDVVGGISGTR
jgi:hypothetical protein